MTGETVISVRDLVVGFGDQMVLDHLSIDVCEGEILGLVGGSGSGKSVLLRTIAGLLPRRQGIIEIFGATLDPLGDKERRTIQRRWGILFQHGALFSSLTAQQNVQFPMRENLSISEKLLTEMAAAKLEMVGLRVEDGRKYPSELSGGMIKRVALARALALDPELVFLDEPTSGLDPLSAREFDVLIRTLQQTLGLTVLMATHDLAVVERACNRVAALVEGRIVAEGTIPAIQESPHPWVRAYFHSWQPAGLRTQSLTT